jgi:hypothetical protein
MVAGCVVGVALLGLQAVRIKAKRAPLKMIRYLCFFMEASN